MEIGPQRPHLRLVEFTLSASLSSAEAEVCRGHVGRVRGRLLSQQARLGLIVDPTRIERPEQVAAEPFLTHASSPQVVARFRCGESRGFGHRSWAYSSHVLVRDLSLIHI